MYVCMYVCMYVWLYVCMYVWCMYGCMYIRMCASINWIECRASFHFDSEMILYHINVHVYGDNAVSEEHIHTYIHTSAHTHTHIHTPRSLA